MNRFSFSLPSLSGFGAGRRSRPAVGIDLGSRRIKAAMLEERAGALVLTRLVDEAIPGAFIAGSDVLDPEGLSEELRRIAGDYGLSRSEAVIMVGGENVIVKRLQVPRSPRDQAWRQLPANPLFVKMLPGDPQNLHYDLDVLDPDGRDLHMNVLVAIAKKDAIRLRQKVVVDAGMSVRAVDVDAFALFNVAKHCMPAALERAAILNIGHEASLLLVIEDGQPVLARHLPVGLSQLVEHFGHSSLLPIDEMEKILFHGNAVSMHPEAFNVWIKSLASEFQLSVGQFTRGRGKSLDVYVCGGGGRVESVPSLLQAAVGGKVSLFNPLDHFRTDGAAQGVGGGRGRKTEGATYAIAIGLALRAVE
jgi:type IV pilus assembly protein PilM